LIAYASNACSLILYEKKHVIMIDAEENGMLSCIRCFCNNKLYNNYGGQIYFFMLKYNSNE